MTGRDSRRSGKSKPHVRIYRQNAGAVRAHGNGGAGTEVRILLVGFEGPRVTPDDVLHLAGEVLSRAHLADSVVFELRDTDPAITRPLTYLLSCVGVETHQPPQPEVPQAWARSS